MMDNMSQNESSRIELVRRYRPIEELLPTHWMQGDVQANGIRQHYYRTGGEKPPLLLLHGFLEGALVWLCTARALEQDYDVIMFDVRGHGGSERIAGHYSQALLTEDIAAAIRALDLSLPRVLGFSLGGTTGILLAAQHPEVVRSLIVGGWSEQPTHNAQQLNESEGYQRWFNSYLAWLEQLKTQTHEERMVAGLSQLPPGAPLLPEEEYVAWIEICARLDLDLVRLGTTLWKDVAELARQTREALRQITCPVLIMQSDFYPTPGEFTLKEQPSKQANVSIVRFEHTGHMIYRERFEAFVELTRRFFAEN
jgi:pimeloyl-ACP methyl ester carboxylesterase